MNQKVVCSLNMSDSNSHYQTSIKNQFNNASKHNINLYKDSNFLEQIKDANFIYELLQKNNVCTVYAKTKNTPFKLCIKPNKLEIYPMDLKKIKTSIDSTTCIDLGFYVEVMLQLVDDFAIYELHTNKMK